MGFRLVSRLVYSLFPGRNTGKTVGNARKRLKKQLENGRKCLEISQLTEKMLNAKMLKPDI